jgi:hypothetical protein
MTTAQTHRPAFRRLLFGLLPLALLLAASTGGARGGLIPPWQAGLPRPPEPASPPGAGAVGRAEFDGVLEDVRALQVPGPGPTLPFAARQGISGGRTTG